MAKDNTGSLRKNDRKEKPTHPDYKGSVTIGGESYWLSGWIKDGEDGKWVSLAFTPREQPPAAKQAPAAVDDDDQLPF